MVSSDNKEIFRISDDVDEFKANSLIATRELIAETPFSIKSCVKVDKLVNIITQIITFQANLCSAYGDFVRFNLSSSPDDLSYNDLPFLPVATFKQKDLIVAQKKNSLSYADRVVMSSGTSGNVQSRIFIDNETSVLQRAALASTLSSFLGFKRRPMFVVSPQDILSSGPQFNAEVAALRGFQIFSSSVTYLLDSAGEPDEKSLEYLRKTSETSEVLVFGLTHRVFQLCERLSQKGCSLSIQRGQVLHGGGWKKLESKGLTDRDLKTAIRNSLGIDSVRQYYGMVEQLGSIFVECDFGNLHTPNFAHVEVLTSVGTQAQDGHKGVLKLFSILPRSYPGCVVLSEDFGIITERDSCACGRLGTAFIVTGRVPKAELRGCSNVL